MYQWIKDFSIRFITDGVPRLHKIKSHLFFPNGVGRAHKKLYLRVVWGNKYKKEIEPISASNTALVNQNSNTDLKDYTSSYVT